MQSLYVVDEKRCSSESNSRSVSPMIREMRGLNLFKAIGRKLGTGRAAAEDGEEDADSSSSSTDSCCSTSAGRCGPQDPADSSADSGCRSSRQSSTNSSDSGSDRQRHHRHHSQQHRSMENVRRALQKLTLYSRTTRSQSCSSGVAAKEKRAKKPAKRILRAPVTYTYVKGLSGLPTQRVPRVRGRVLVNGMCTCNVPCVVSLRR